MNETDSAPGTTIEDPSSPASEATPALSDEGVEGDGVPAPPAAEPSDSDPSVDPSVDPSDGDPASAGAITTAGAIATTGGGRSRGAPDLEQEGEVAADYLEGLLDIVDLDGDLDLDVEGDRAVVAIVGAAGLSALVGRDGETLEALQELTRLAVLTATGSRSRLMLDISGWRAGRRAALGEQGTAAAQRVLASGAAERLAVMSPFERKVVHDAVGAVEGVHSESEGEEPHRRVVVLPG